MRSVGYSRRAADASNDVIYANQYLTFVPSADATFTFTKRGTGDDIQYSIDDGAWVALASGVASPTVQTGHNIRWRATLEPKTNASSAANNGIGTFASSADYVAKGNPISLLEGNKFIGVRRFTYGRVFVSLFLGDTHLTDASDMSLVAMVVTTYCYYGMFQGCTALVSAPELPALVVSTYCYQNTFNGCTALVNAPSILPATTLASNCYRAMFQGCTALANAPILPASVLVSLCYYMMFDGCSSLNYIMMLATDVSASSCLSNWVRNVAKTGTFIKDTSMTSMSSGNGGIPRNWVVIDNQNVVEYLTFKPITDATFTFTKRGTGSDIEYSINNGEWTSIASDVATPTVEAGQTIRWRGSLIPAMSGDSADEYGVGKFSATADYDAEGNPLSLVHKDGFGGVRNIQYDCQFVSLFWEDTHIVDASKMVLIAKNITTRAYRSMFNGCTSLLQAPKMAWFNANTYCCWRMFHGCSALTTSPLILTGTLALQSLYQMFRLASNLNYVTMMATDVSASNCLGNWLANVAASGTVVKDANTNIPTGTTNGIPTGWTATDV